MQVSMNIGLFDDQENDSAKALLCVAEAWFVCWSICSSRIYAGAEVLYPIQNCLSSVRDLYEGDPTQFPIFVYSDMSEAVFKKFSIQVSQKRIIMLSLLDLLIKS
ncbi:MAG: hypothetical protein EZS28_010339 [Streblomastix strix]|uniref:Uncharacterized protein n=1 Tax=Streblomastix strix TaxID=222440 RepID=A0A5J4WGU6_9EUKA|nr:MAG: hypothetical protein EZS28_010339 [Streblomastix strix]